MNVKSHGFDFRDMNTLAQGRKTEPLLFIAIHAFADSDKFLNNADSFLFNFVLISETPLP